MGDQVRVDSVIGCGGIRTVCQDVSSGAIYRFACTRGWRVLERVPYPSIDEALRGSSPDFEIAAISWTAASAQPRDEVLALVEKLPEGGDISEILPVVERVLDERSLSALEVATALHTCADHVWHTYEEPIPPEVLRSRLIQRCRELLSSPDERVLYRTISAVMILGLVDLIPDLERTAANAQRCADLRTELADAVSKLRTDPYPYSSLRRFQRQK